MDDNSEVQTLWERLKKEESVLIILDDDVWEKKLETDRVGVTCGSGSRCCKIVWTTRNMDVCGNAQRKIHMCSLPGKESWSLFREKARKVVDQDGIKPIAEKGL